ncbi:MAG: hypothetical protein HC898_05855 [Phycisphaerales bacterium]|nr:hypothetical protein [Phycisphaerales bacterium]
MAKYPDHSRVDPGAAGSFAAPTVLTSSTGGSSRIGTINGLLGAASQLITDAPIQYNRTTAGGGTVVAPVGYALAAITTNNPLETQLAALTTGQTFIFTSASAGTVTIRLTGAWPDHGA